MIFGQGKKTLGWRGRRDARERGAGGGLWYIRGLVATTGRGERRRARRGLDWVGTGGRCRWAAVASTRAEGARANGTAVAVAISIRASVGGNQLLRAGVPIQWHSGPKGPRNFERAQGSLSTWSKRLKNKPTWSNLNGKARAQILPCQAADQRLKVLQVGIQRTRVTCPLPTNELLTVLHLIFS